MKLVFKRAKLAPYAPNLNIYSSSSKPSKPLVNFHQPEQTHPTSEQDPEANLQKATRHQVDIDFTIKIDITHAFRVT